MLSQVKGSFSRFCKRISWLFVYEFVKELAGTVAMLCLDNGTDIFGWMSLLIGL